MKTHSLVLSSLSLFTCLTLQGHAGTTASHPSTATPSSSQIDQTFIGYLKVFSATQETQWGDSDHYYPHTGYRIYDNNGNLVQWVENHNTVIDDQPQVVELAPGTYTIWAQSEKNGFVKVPVVVRHGRLTTVSLLGGGVTTLG